jgi:hypothetical protein
MGERDADDATADDADPPSPHVHLPLRVARRV